MTNDEAYCGACYGEGPFTRFDGQVWSWDGRVVEEHGDFCSNCYWQIKYYSIESMTREGWERDQQMQIEHEAQREHL